MESAEPPRFILFVPPVPSPPSLDSLKTALGDTISQVLKEVASHSSDASHAAILEIALACPELVGKQHSPRALLYDALQSNLAAVYKLVCVIAAKDSIDVEDSEGVDVRVLLVAWSPHSTSPDQTYGGALVDLRTLAQSGRQWQYAFGVESDDGEAMVRAFVAAKGLGEQVSRVQNDAQSATEGKAEQAQRQATATSSSAAQEKRQRNYHVAVGGTFDHLHIGHKLLLTMTLFAVDDARNGGAAERSATIGITGDQLLVNKKHAEVLESWDMRQQAVQRFLDSILNLTTSPPRITTREAPGPNGKSIDLHYADGLVVKCTEIQDPFGPTITEEQISALVISGETRSGGKAVNDKRKEKGWAELEVFEVDVLDAEDEGAEVKEGFGSKLSSTAIREKLARQTGTGGSKI